MKWIWLPTKLYPNCQNARINALSGKNEDGYTVCEFKKSYTYGKKVRMARLSFCGDTAFQLYLNGNIVATGPASVGGDFIGNDSVRDEFYYYETEHSLDCETLDFFARVRLMPVQICEYSKGHGGFTLCAELTFDDGTVERIKTDESWLVRRNGAYLSSKCYDGRIKPDEYVCAEVTEDIWRPSLAPIPVREETVIEPKGNVIVLKPGEIREATLELDMIWGGFVSVEAESEGEVSVEVGCRENTENPRTEKMTFNGSGSYRGFTLQSAGQLVVKAINLSAGASKVRVSFIATHYPIYEEAETVTSDKALNVVLSTCKHALKICRQTHHLDSPKHCEPLACTGDYYIESLMTQFSFGDMRLAAFDAVRTARLLERENGRMFHTTYSLIWVAMLYDTYMAVGDKALLKECVPALKLLLDRFNGYVGENGIIENPPDYMFIDWLFIDGISLHHPPKALGQSCLNMFYYGALDKAEAIYRELSDEKSADECKRRRESLRAAVNKHLYDEEKGIYFEGLNTPIEESAVYKWQPQNTEKRYYRKHANILAAYVGICNPQTAKRILKAVMGNVIEGDVQPYFLHFLFEALFRCGLEDEYTLKLAQMWKAPTLEFPKGIVEGFYAPEPTYHFDHSHAWGGTPLYSVPKALMGLEIIEPGMRKIKLSPSLLGLLYARSELLTPYGKVTVEQRSGEKALITAPKEIAVIIEK